MKMLLIPLLLLVVAQKVTEEKAKKFGIKKPTDTMKLEEVKSEKHNEKYEVIYDEVEVEKSGYQKETLKKILLEKMDSRNDRKEDNELTIERAQGKEKKLVIKMKKKKKPQNAWNRGETSEKDFDFGVFKLKVTASGACTAQNQNILKDLKLPIRL